MQQSTCARYQERASSQPNATGSRSTVAFTPSDHLDNIFQAVRQQVDLWGENAKWKIELVALPPPDYSDKSPQQPPIARKGQYWADHDLQQNLRASLERQRYLEGVIRSQEEKLKELRQLQQQRRRPQNAAQAIEAMRAMHLKTQQEERERHKLENRLLKKQIDTLTRKLKRITATLQHIESIQPAPEEIEMGQEELLEDRKVLLRKLHLMELRLRARDAELSYLHDTLDRQQHAFPRLQDSYQDNHRQLSGLESLGIVADQVLSNPNFDIESSDCSPHLANYNNSRSPNTSEELPTKRQKNVSSRKQSANHLQDIISKDHNSNEKVDARRAPTIAALLDPSPRHPEQQSTFRTPIPIHRPQLKNHNLHISYDPSTENGCMPPPPAASRKRRWSFDMRENNNNTTAPV